MMSSEHSILRLCPQQLSSRAKVRRLRAEFVRWLVLRIVGSDCAERPRLTSCISPETGGCYETWPQAISASGRRRCRAAGRASSCEGTCLPVAAGALDRAIYTGRADRHRGTPDGAMAVGTAPPALPPPQPPPPPPPLPPPPRPA